MENVEATFIKQFTNGNRTKGMNILRPKPKRERHRLTFSTGINLTLLGTFLLFHALLLNVLHILMRNDVSGFLGGCMFSLIVALVAIVRTRNILQDDGQKQYMNTMFPLYR